MASSSDCRTYLTTTKSTSWSHARTRVGRGGVAVLVVRDFVCVAVLSVLCCGVVRQILQGVKVTVGVVVSHMAVGYVNKTENGWGYYMANGKVGHAGPAQRVYASHYVPTDTITVDLLSRPAIGKASVALAGEC